MPADRLSVFVYLPVPVPLAVFVLRLEAVEPAEADSRLLLRTLFLSLEMRGVRLVSGESWSTDLEASALFARCVRRFCFLRRVLLCAK